MDSLFFANKVGILSNLYRESGQLNQAIITCQFTAVQGKLFQVSFLIKN